MSNVSAPPLLPKPRPSRLWTTFKALIRARVTAGLATVLPIWLAFWAVKLVFGWMRDASGWVVKWFLSSDYGKPILEKWVTQAKEKWPFNFQELTNKLGHPPTLDDLWNVLQAKLERPPNIDDFLIRLPTEVQWGIAIFSVLLTIFLLYVIGLFTANLFGRRILEGLELLLDRLPLIKTIYRATKQILNAFTGEQAQNFQRVALIPFPTKGVWSVGFITSIKKDPATGEEICTTFVACTPNPTTGYVFILKRSDVIELDWTIEDAVRIVMSGGILTPERMTLYPKPPADATLQPLDRAPKVS